MRSNEGFRPVFLLLDWQAQRSRKVFYLRQPGKRSARPKNHQTTQRLTSLCSVRDSLSSVRDFPNRTSTKQRQWIGSRLAGGICRPRWYSSTWFAVIGSLLSALSADLVHSGAHPSTRILLDSTARIAPVALVSRYSRFVLSFLAYWNSGNALRASLVAPGRTSLSFSSLI